MIFNKCFWLGCKLFPIEVEWLITAKGLPITYVAYKCTRCNKIETNSLMGVHLTLDQVRKEYK